MFRRLIGQMTDRLLTRAGIGGDERDIYVYGMDVFLAETLYVGSIVILGFLLREVWQSILFLLCFRVLRTYTGGYHTSKPLRCYLLTIAVTATTLSAMKWFVVHRFICCWLLIVSSMIILSLAPIEAENKPLESIERNVYRVKTVKVWCIETLAAAVAAAMKLNGIVALITLVYVDTAISMLAERIVRHRKM